MKKFLSSLLIVFATVCVAPAYADEPTNTCASGQMLRQYESAVGTVAQNGTPTPTNPVEPTFYNQGDMVLRKVGDYADSYDATTGKITRRVGVKVFDGTEFFNESAADDYRWDSSSYATKAPVTDVLCSHIPFSLILIEGPFIRGMSSENISFRNIPDAGINVNSFHDFKQYLSQQYSAGTPVTVYYPLAEAVEEDWTGGSTYCADPIKIATTAYNDAQFAPVEQALESAVTTIKDVVANTIVQADAIQNLQDTKQTMPDANGTNGTCPRFRQCLLIETANGTPQWFPIIDPFKDFVTPILANNDHITGVDNQRRYYGDQQLCTVLADTDLAKCTNNTPATYNTAVSYNTLHGALKENEWGYEFKAADIGATPATDNPNNDEGIVYGISKCVSTEIANPGFAKPATSTQLNNALWDARPTTAAEADKYRSCWCKTTGIAYGGQYYETSAAPWVFHRAFGSAAGCAGDCAIDCAYLVRGNAAFRSAVLGWAVE